MTSVLIPDGPRDFEAVPGRALLTHAWKWNINSLRVQGIREWTTLLVDNQLKKANIFWFGP